MNTIVICEKPSQAAKLRKALGGRFGDILPAQGHLLALAVPEEVNDSWKSWTYDVLRPPLSCNGGLYPTKVSPDNSASAKAALKRIADALKKADRVIIATDADREGTLIGGELIAHYGFKGTVLRAYFAAEDPTTLRKSFESLKAWETGPDREYAAGMARQQADQVYNLTLTRSVTLGLAQNGTPVGVGRVKTPTLAIVCRRELEIQNFKPETYFEVTAQAAQNDRVFAMRHRRSDSDRIGERGEAENIVAAAEGHKGPLEVSRETKRQGPPKPPDLPTLQKRASKERRWSAKKTLDVLQALYETHQIVTYPRAEARYLPETAIEDVEILKRAIAGLPCLAGVDLGPTEIRKGKSGIFSDAGLAGCSHHAVVPNVNTADTFASVYARLTSDERWLFDTVVKFYAAGIMRNHVYDQTTASVAVPYVSPATRTSREAIFKATGRVAKDWGWRLVYGADKREPDDEDGEGGAGALPPLENGAGVVLSDVDIDQKRTEPPSRYDEGGLIGAMQDAWKFVDDEQLRLRLKEAKGIGTPATRDEVISGLQRQGMIGTNGKWLVPTPRGMAVYQALLGISEDLVDPGVTAQWELLLDEIQIGKLTLDQVLDGITDQTAILVDGIRAREGKVAIPDALGKSSSRRRPNNGGRRGGKTPRRRTG